MYMLVMMMIGLFIIDAGDEELSMVNDSEDEQEYRAKKIFSENGMRRSRRGKIFSKNGAYYTTQSI